MYYDPKTKRYIGELRMLTPEEEAELDRRVANGDAYSTEHPSEETLNKIREINERLGVWDNLNKLMEQVTDEELEACRAQSRFRNLPDWGNKL